MSDYSELKRLAESATQCHGPRRVETDHNKVHRVLGDGSWTILSAWHTPDGKALDNAKFTAAASPTAVLDLIAENERLERAVKRRNDNLTMLRGDVESKDQRIRNHFETIDALADERDQLKAENEELGKDILETELRALKYIHRFAEASNLGRGMRVALEAIVALRGTGQEFTIAHDALEPFRTHAAAMGKGEQQ